MSILDKFKNLITVEDDDYDEDDEYEEDYEDDYAPPYNEPRAPINTAATRPPFSSPKYSSPASPGDGYKSYRTSREEPASSGSAIPYSRENVINMPNSRNEAVQRITQRFKIVVIDPKGFEDCPQLVDSLKAKKPVIINLETLETDKARKIFDFLSGATYALSGNVQKIAANIFIFMPANVDISSPVEDQGTAFRRDSGKSPFI